MESLLEQELDELRQKLLLMAGRAETAVSKSVQALMLRDHDLALCVCQDDDAIDTEYLSQHVNLLLSRLRLVNCEVFGAAHADGCRVMPSRTSPGNE